MTSTLNPFGFNRPVTLFQDLVGRRQEIGYILKAQQYSDSNSLVGMPKIGSTSLLRCLFLPPEHRHIRLGSKRQAWHSQKNAPSGRVNMLESPARVPASQPACKYQRRFLHHPSLKRERFFKNDSWGYGNCICNIASIHSHRWFLFIEKKPRSHDK